MNSASVVLESVTKKYRGSFTLGPISIALTPGITCLVGANGAGKSTLFRVIAGIERPTSGTVKHGDKAVTAIGYLPQDPKLPGSASCAEFLNYVAWLQRISKNGRGRAVEDALSTVNLKDRADVRIKALSGGMRRRIGIAQAIVHKPALLLLDEPTAGLDPRQRVKLRETVAAVSEHRIVIVSTHLVEDVRALGGRVIVLNAGSIVHDGTVSSLEALAKPDSQGGSSLERAIGGLMGDSGEE